MNKPGTFPRPGTQRGAAALIVVMLLFFIVSLVAAYAGRNLIFEQKTSANQYRATQAFEAAEAGLEWALAMLNGGRIDTSCENSTNATDSSFRARYLVETAGNYTPSTWDNAGVPERFQPSCVRSDDPDNPWTCSCPTASRPVLAAPASAGVFPAFRVCFEAVDPPQPGVMRVVSTGRTSINGLVDQLCEERGEGTAGEAAATVSVVVALSSALPAPPMAALTAVGNLSAAGGLTLVNTDPQANGLTANLAWPLPGWPFEPVLITAAGSSISRSYIDDDIELRGLTPQELFTSVFRMRPETFRLQPAAVVLADCGSACSAKLREAAERNPGRIIWIDGDATLESPVDLDPSVPPVLIVTNGNLRVLSPLQIEGVIYAKGNVEVLSTTSVKGAVVAAGDVDILAPTTIVYDSAIVKQLRLASGSLVRVPGSWRDFP
jgi:hypothetical protein